MPDVVAYISSKPMSRMRIPLFQSNGIEYLGTAIPLNPALSGGPLRPLSYYINQI